MPLRMAVGHWYLLVGWLVVVDRYTTTLRVERINVRRSAFVWMEVNSSHGFIVHLIVQLELDVYGFIVHLCTCTRTGMWH
jgi:hypothetical protein